ncbi:KIR-like protein [Plasmodium knowlesi strain H]|uniref:KIR-like protein n=3 Tax=Plasmodium knowlesi TaxID=5850 RepID=A0A5K1V4B5_PLAKH|nr:KIR-like protein [Plasmodium knowlesi strain H]OTN67803.1 KIR-like protein [Plasmodium knowlesi]CAA9990301.1 KIR-like protein [Plasmodium knowlesi strain H]SBO19507.1 KIR-like protein [Plasmodium knowlesi strain H]SBO22822.1 KIR-like protein [Plasmodium knowlesi strain H]VVS79775.1 KIR-like protein [Plasmodium knowlesi strain H]|eukprot:XP_002260701.1 KIR-like protein [Plasmodium knowlesi strain H]
MSESKEGGKKLQCSQQAGLLRAYKSQLGQRIEEISSKDMNAADDVPPIWCCISGAYTEKIKGDGGCDLLYYAAGSLVFRNLVDKTSFDRIMEEVYEIVGQQLRTSECTIQTSASGKRLFELLAEPSISNLKHDGIWQTNEHSGNVSCEKCTNYLRELAKACRKVEKYCKDGDNTENCRDVAVGGNQGDPGYVAQLIETLIPELPVASEKTKNDQQGQEGEDTCLGKLPSEEVYKKFSEAQDYCGSSSTGGDIRTVLGRILNEPSTGSNYADQIIRGACYANGTAKESFRNGERCNALYYWVGNALSTTPKSVLHFKDLVDAAYDKFREFNVEKECTDIYPKIDKDIFNNMKLIYDYSTDHAALKQYAQGSRDTESPCIDNYYMYLEIVASAYRGMREYCGKSGAHVKCCENFRSMTAKHSLQELLQLKCSLKNTSDCPTSIAPAAISGTLITAGLPALGYFLYKYDLLPSSISNRLKSIVGGGSSRSRRVRSVRRNFDGSTADDASTVGSTLGDDSTVDYSTAEDVSTIYNDDDEPPRRPSGRTRTGTNNRRPGNIRYYAT